MADTAKLDHSMMDIEVMNPPPFTAICRFVSKSYILPDAQFPYEYYDTDRYVDWVAGPLGEMYLCRPDDIVLTRHEMEILITSGEEDVDKPVAGERHVDGGRHANREQPVNRVNALVKVVGTSGAEGHITRRDIVKILCEKEPRLQFSSVIFHGDRFTAYTGHYVQVCNFCCERGPRPRAVPIPPYPEMPVAGMDGYELVIDGKCSDRRFLLDDDTIVVNRWELIPHAYVDSPLIEEKIELNIVKVGPVTRGELFSAAAEILRANGLDIANNPIQSAIFDEAHGELYVYATF